MKNTMDGKEGTETQDFVKTLIAQMKTSKLNSDDVLEMLEEKFK